MENKMDVYKKVSESKTEQVHIVMYSDINGFKRLFGGILLQWMDVVAGVAARRHSGCNVTTAAIDNLQFKAPAYANETIVLHGRVTWVGSSSMEVRVDAFTEALDGEKKLINTAYFIVVALDEDEHPVRVPRLICETDEERAEYAAAEQRQAHRREMRQKQNI